MFICADCRAMKPHERHADPHHILSQRFTFIPRTYSAKYPYVLKINEHIKEARYQTKASVFTNFTELNKTQPPCCSVILYVFYMMAYLQNPPICKTAGFSVLAQWTNFFCRTGYFHSHHLHPRPTSHRLSACLTDPQITSLWEAEGRASGLQGSPGGPGLAQRR